MKLPFLPALLLSLSAAGLSFSAPLEIADNVTTASGRSYSDCRILQRDPDGVIFAHKTGMAKVLYDELSDNLRVKFGYDAEKAASYAKEQAENKRKAQEQRVEIQKELIKANAAITVAEIQRAQFAEQNYGGGVACAAPFPGYGFDNGFYANGYQGRNWNYGADCGIIGHGRYTFPSRGSTTPALNVLSSGRGFNFRPCPPAARVPFAVPALGISTPARTIGLGGARGGH